jgi:hypothetical protein
MNEIKNRIVLFAQIQLTAFLMVSFGIVFILSAPFICIFAPSKFLWEEPHDCHR